MYVQLQALAVWKMARRERMLSAKITRLAGSPCSYEPVSIPFSISNGNNAGRQYWRVAVLGLVPADL